MPVHPYFILEEKTMKCEIPLTYEQSVFAAENHNLVYKFLSENRLPESEYYDIVIFGFLKAVRDYLSQPSLQKYTFTTIAWKIMSRSLFNHYRAQRSGKRNAQTVSIHEGLYEDDLPLEQTIPAPDTLMLHLETELLLHDLARRISTRQMDMVRLKTCGYSDRDIARKQNIPMKRVRELLDEIRMVLEDICCE